MILAAEIGGRAPVSVSSGHISGRFGLTGRLVGEALDWSPSRGDDRRMAVPVAAPGIHEDVRRMRVHVASAQVGKAAAHQIVAHVLGFVGYVDYLGNHRLHRSEQAGRRDLGAEPAD